MGIAKKSGTGLSTVTLALWQSAFVLKVSSVGVLFDEDGTDNTISNNKRRRGRLNFVNYSTRLFSD